MEDDHNLCLSSIRISIISLSVKNPWLEKKDGNMS